ncbi:MAG TPA: Rieske 2Fe-2S domain-containing protein [Tepidiformaceae bacterium]|jgi:cytochrome b6-f complex iron-sulfur subunit|nr:Rieske 2Fe-2S domain-containing protein [Tepidiformaceae bacterium]
MATADSSAPRSTARRLEQAKQVEARKVARRSFLRVSAFAGLTLFGGTLLSGFLGFFNLRHPTGFGGVVTVAKARVPQPSGTPERVSDGKFWLVNLAGAEGDVLGIGGTGGLLALYWKCPHLGCTVPWVPGFQGSQVNFPGVNGWFRCPCHGSTYSRAGVRVFGPAPRPMDTMLLSVNGDGSVNVNTGKITGGAADNPLRAVAYNG